MSTEGSVFEPAPAWERMPAFTTVRRGYDPAQVLTFVKQARERIEALETKIGEMEQEREELARDRDVALQSWEAGSGPKEPYDAMAGRLADLMRSFDAEVEKLRADAQAESERTLTEARAESDRILEQAQGSDAEAREEADQIVRQAREEADRIVGKARTEADQVESDLFAVYGSTINELRGIRDHMQNAVREIDIVLESGAGDQVVVLEKRGEQRRAEEQPARPDAPSEFGR
jgi:cell division septum initiation protein DivIVA